MLNLVQVINTVEFCRVALKVCVEQSCCNYMVGNGVVSQSTFDDITAQEVVREASICF